MIMKRGVIMSKAGISLNDIKNEFLKDEEFKKEYDRLKPRYDVISQVVSIRKQLNMTQEELANKIGTQKSNISRLENGNQNPSIDLLYKIANALGRDLTIN